MESTKKFAENGVIDDDQFSSDDDNYDISKDANTQLSKMMPQCKFLHWVNEALSNRVISEAITERAQNQPKQAETGLGP